MKKNIITLTLASLLALQSITILAADPVINAQDKTNTAASNTNNEASNNNNSASNNNKKASNLYAIIAGTGIVASGGFLISKLAKNLFAKKTSKKAIVLSAIKRNGKKIALIGAAGIGAAGLVTFTYWLFKKFKPSKENSNNTKWEDIRKKGLNKNKRKPATKKEKINQSTISDQPKIETSITNKNGSNFLKKQASICTNFLPKTKHEENFIKNYLEPKKPRIPSKENRKQKDDAKKEATIEKIIKTGGVETLLTKVGSKTNNINANNNANNINEINFGNKKNKNENCDI